MAAPNNFITVYNLLDAGYRGTGWFLALAGLLLFILVYIFWLKPDSRGERIYRLSVILIWLLACSVLLTYHYRGYRAYSGFAHSLRNGDAQQTVGAITYVQAEDYFLYFDVDGKRFRCSRHQWPFRLGFQPGDFVLKPTFLVGIYTVDEVIVRLDVHRATLGDNYSAGKQKP
ncbi:MAG: hypothetical protein JXA04_07795 [Gammaproteobacteria bacterium]|nr:hypothetical protein [Gammaproteobacteria bacterium]